MTQQFGKAPKLAKKNSIAYAIHKQTSGYFVYYKNRKRSDNY